MPHDFGGSEQMPASADRMLAKDYPAVMAKAKEYEVKQFCKECDEERTIYWTHIHLKNAGGEVVQDDWSGRCGANHEQPTGNHP